MRGSNYGSWILLLRTPEGGKGRGLLCGGAELHAGEGIIRNGDTGPVPSRPVRSGWRTKCKRRTLDRKKLFLLPAARRSSLLHAEVVRSPK